MPLPASGPISLTDIQNEFGGPTPIVLSNYYKGGAYVENTDFAPNVPASGPISLTNFYGSRKTTLTTVTFTSAGDNFIVLPATFAGNLIVQTMTGGGGGGGGTASGDFSGFPGYAGLRITDGNISAAPGDLINLFVGGGGGAGGTGGGGGGNEDEGKIICTKLFELGLLPREIYLADQAFGEQLRQQRPDVYYGYRAWAEIVVDWMSGQGPKVMFWMDDQKFSESSKSWSIRWAKDIATPWAHEMAYRMGQTDRGSVTGRIIMLIGMPVSKVVGVWQRWFGPSKQSPGLFKGLLLISIFCLLKTVAEIGKIFERP
jgi:hypothetical protein